MISRFVIKCTMTVVFVAGFSLGCQKENPGAGAQSNDRKSVDSSLFDGGFTVQKASKCENGTKTDCELSIVDGSGNSLGGKAKDLKEVREVGSDRVYTVYAWPVTVRLRDYEEIGKQMREYSNFVGTLLGPGADITGPGAEDWVSFRRSQQYSAYTDAAASGTKSYCSAVVNELVESLLPEGSKFRQYGNCGEGGRIGACLAKKAGFRDDEIRVCASRNDHFFGMVKKGNAWCILDRWALVNSDNFACDVDWNKDTQTITHQGKTMEDKWFQKVTCVTFEKFINDGGEVALLPEVFYPPGDLGSGAADQDSSGF